MDSHYHSSDPDSRPYDLVVVDDDTLVHEIIKRGLRTLSVSAKYFSDSTVALDFLEHNSTDILVVDYNLPGKNGLEVLTALSERSFSVCRRAYLCSSIALPANEAEHAMRLAATPLLKDQLIDRFFLKELLISNAQAA